MTLHEVCGNIWDYPAAIVVIPTNGFVNISGRAVMGAGLALQAANRYPDLPEVLAKCIHVSGNHVHVIRHNIVAFPTKEHWRDPSSLGLIEAGALELASLANMLDWRARWSVALPRLGCGLGGLRWAHVKPILEKYLDDRFVVVDNS